MFVKKKTFSGGYRFRNFKGKPEKSLTVPGMPEKVIIPMKQGFGNEMPSLVKEGDMVRAGQIIARQDDYVSSPVHSTVNGRVEKIERINYFKKETTACTIKADGTSEYMKLDGHSSDWNKLTDERIEELIYLSGASSLDEEGIPTRYKSSVISPEEVENVIIHSAASEAYNLSVSLLLDGKNFFNFVEGLKILKRVLHRAHFHLAFGTEYGDLIQQFSKLLSGIEWISLYVLEPKYPQGYDEVLIPTVLGKKFPYGYSAANIGVVVLNVQAVLHVYEAVAEGKPLIERTLALCGTGFKENLHVKVRVGTPLEYIVSGRMREGQELRFISNSLLSGVRLSDLSLPIDRKFSHIISITESQEREFLSFLAPGVRKDSYSKTFLSSVLKSEKDVDTNIRGEERPCIFCNFCQEVCPVGIIPHIFFHYVEKNIVEEPLLDLGIFKCIECNLCSYVCPSKINLAKYIKDGKEILITKGCDHTLCILPHFNLKGLEEYRGIK